MVVPSAAEPIENMGQKFGRNSLAVITDRNSYAAVDSSRRNTPPSGVNFTALTRIPDYLLEAHISRDVTRLPIKRTRNMDPFSIGAGPTTSINVGDDLVRST